jgi:hypothetical protein
MSIAESGYGWTRTALQANNLFGWKYYSAAAAGGRKSFTLACQPPKDVNNHYVVFMDAADAVDFVAAKLATLPVYKHDADEYRKARAAGLPGDESAKAWLAGIASPYNWQPERYIRTVTRIMNDPLMPSDDVSPERNLYKITPPLDKSEANPVRLVATSQDTDVQVKTSAWFAARLSTRQCDTPVVDFPRWNGFPVQRCGYNDSGVKVQTYMLNPAADKLARWTVTACKDANSNDLATCAAAVSKTIMSASSGVFPVAGFIPEPASSGGGTGSSMVCFLFRDGVTVTTRVIPNAPAAISSACPDADNDGAIVTAKKYARVASTTRDEYRKAGGTEPVGTDKNGDPRWADVIRRLYQEAWNSDRNVLISAKAKSLMAAKSIH